MTLYIYTIWFRGKPETCAPDIESFFSVAQPKDEIINDESDSLSEEIVTKVEIDDDFDEFDGVPEIIRNQAKSKRARFEARVNLGSGKRLRKLSL